MKAVEFTGRIQQDGHLAIPVSAQEELALGPDATVRVVLMRAEEDIATGAVRASAWGKVDDLRQRLASKPFSLTDALLDARREEDDPR